MLIFLGFAIIVGVGRRFMHKVPLGEPSSPSFLIVEVVLGARLLGVDSLPKDGALYTAEGILRLYGDMATCN